MPVYVNRAGEGTSTTGQGTVTLSGAVSNEFFQFDEAGLSDSDEVTYLLKEGSDFELGTGTFGDVSGVRTVSRDTVTKSNIGSTHGTTKLTLAGSAEVYVVHLAADIATTPSAASDTVAGVIEIAVQSEMEAASSTTLAVSPGRQHYHPSAAKGWLIADFAGTNDASYNVSGVTDGGTGIVTCTWDTDFSSVNYAFAVNLINNSDAQFAYGNTIAVGSLLAICVSATIASPSTVSIADGLKMAFIAFGDQ